MKITAICFGFLGGLTGIVATVYWCRSSKIPIETANFEPLETEDKAMDLSLGTLKAFTESATLNKKAAGWTAVSVFLWTVSSVLGNVS